MIAGKRSRILVVDDEDRNRRLMEAMISPLGHEVILASDGEEGLAKAVSESPDLILLDVMMPKLNGFEVAQRLKENWQTKTIPIVIVTALREVEDRVRALEAGADDFLSKPVDKIELRARITSLLKVKAYHEYLRNYQKMLEEEVEHKTRELKSAFQKIKGASLETILRLCRAAEFKDEETGNHLRRVSRYVAIVARDLGLSANYQEQLIYAAPMHDIGKIGIPEKILLKKGKLDPGEWEIMKQHTTIGAKILSGSNEEFIKLGELIALTHHERWDGSGYPRGLKEDEIPICGQITAIADAFEAMTSDRCYSPAMPREDALDVIRRGTGVLFSPQIAATFLAARDEIISVRISLDNTEESFLSLATKGLEI
ncbi:MAG: two-component system response regulator [Candidatus Aminicenantes bacterium RBG_16_63_16]|nr:MAG: two-component system response regulator [Candidatus Aminicenantes bacterium RBG_16_63_16]